MLRQSGLFDAEFYAARAPDLPAGENPLAHYHDHGWRKGVWPNPYFDTVWYIASNPDVAAQQGDPLLHYACYGEAESRRPIAWFDPAWYRAHHAVPDTSHSLAHFLRHRTGGAASPIPEFDAAWYCARYRDVAAAGMDPFEHYLIQGFREARDPSPAFDTRFYRQRYLRAQPEQNPLLHYLAHRADPGIHPRLPAGETTIARELARFSAAGSLFEPVAPLPPNTTARARVLAYYLPQFHPIPQNDAWWGAGFTEWRNVARGLPRFAGHYQPRIPRDLGYYSLDDPQIMPRQIALARGAGLSGFIFHFYWFDRQRLLERPIERFLTDPTLDFPFCLMWANENWTRRWDGSDDEVLIRQHYAEADEAALIACFARHFADPRYVRLHGRPLLMIYRPGLIPQAAATIARWRVRFLEAHGEAPILVMAQSFGDTDPRPFGLDGATEFPPHKLTADLPRRDSELEVLDDQFGAQVYDYADLVAASVAAPRPEFPLIRAAVPGWDNDARRQGQGLVLHGATPAAYQAWLTTLIEQAVAHPCVGVPLVCINAWNEWAEGAYLEPDQHFGAAFLNATGRAIAATAAAPRMLLIGHDAYPAGAQMLLLHIARHLQAAHGVALEIVLGGPGELLPRYTEIAPTTVIADPAALAAHLRNGAWTAAIVNSAASAWCCPTLRDNGVQAILLVHELPALLTTQGLLDPLCAAIGTVHHVVYPAEGVRAALAPLLPAAANSRSMILPQGVYRSLAAAPDAAELLRRDWGAARTDPVAIGIGHGDRRKGFDLFVSVWQSVAAAQPTLHMVWVGAVDISLRRALANQIAAAEATGRFHLTGWRDDVAALLAAADALLLTSREDPYPSVALEAICAGLEVVAFAGSGGIPDLLIRSGAGQVVPAHDCAAMAAALPRTRQPRRDHSAIAAAHRFDSYVSALLQAVWPDRPRVSVIVPCYNQAAMLPRRLRSLFAQTVPVEQIVLHDDASTDGSAAVARDLAGRAGRTLTVVEAARNSGSAFGHWHAAVAAASGELIWIAEADDGADPTFLARLVEAIAPPDTLFAFCDSRPIDAAGDFLALDYQASYAAAGGAEALAADASFEAAEFAERFLAERNILFNVSAVLWRRIALLRALERLGDGLLQWRVAGDWRVYLEVATSLPGRIAHVAAPLNQHCRHPHSVTSTLSSQRHLTEIGDVQRLALQRFTHVPDLPARQARYLQQAAAHLRSGPIPQS